MACQVLNTRHPRQIQKLRHLHRRIPLTTLTQTILGAMMSGVTFHGMVTGVRLDGMKVGVKRTTSFDLGAMRTFVRTEEEMEGSTEQPVAKAFLMVDLGNVKVTMKTVCSAAEIACKGRKDFFHDTAAPPNLVRK